MKSKLLAWIIFLRFYFKQLSISLKLLVFLNLFLLLSSIFLSILHWMKINISSYYFFITIVSALNLEFIRKKTMQL